MRPGRPGFTVIEAALVLALCGLVAWGAVGAAGRLAAGVRLRTGIWQVTSGLNQARFQAILSGEPRRVRFAAPGLVFERYDEASGAWRASRAVPLDGVVVRANNTPTFHPQGTVSDLATISVSNGRGSYRITVAITGRIRTVRTGRLRRGTGRPSSAAGPAGGRHGGSSSGPAPSPCWCAGIRRPSRRRWRRHPSGAT